MNIFADAAAQRALAASDEAAGRGLDLQRAANRAERDGELELAAELRLRARSEFESAGRLRCAVSSGGGLR